MVIHVCSHLRSALHPLRGHAFGISLLSFPFYLFVFLNNPFFIRIEFEHDKEQDGETP